MSENFEIGTINPKQKIDLSPIRKPSVVCDKINKFVSENVIFDVEVILLQSLLFSRFIKEIQPVLIEFTFP